MRVQQPPLLHIISPHAFRPAAWHRWAVLDASINHAAACQQHTHPGATHICQPLLSPLPRSLGTAAQLGMAPSRLPHRRPCCTAVVLGHPAAAGCSQHSQHAQRALDGHPLPSPLCPLAPPSPPDMCAGIPAFLAFSAAAAEEGGGILRLQCPQQAAAAQRACSGAAGRAELSPPAAGLQVAACTGQPIVWHVALWQTEDAA